MSQDGFPRSSDQGSSEGNDSRSLAGSNKIGNGTNHGQLECGQYDDAPALPDTTLGLKNGHIIEAGTDKDDDGQDDMAMTSDYANHVGEKQPLIPGRRSPRTRSMLCERTNSYIYLSHFLSAWGDNMWTFAVGVFLVEIDGDSLQLTASFGLTMGVSTLLLGPIIGDWVDSMPRLRAAQEALVMQNVMIALCSGFVYNVLEFESEVEGWGEWGLTAHYVLIILLGTGAYLAHIANTIAIERDWVVEICAKDEDRLASMTATMRAIDLTAMIVAPIATGQIMTLTSSKIGALFIAGWNVVSFFVEYILLWKVYTSVPALQREKDFTGSDSDENRTGLITSHPELVESMGQSRTLLTSSHGSKLVKDEAETNVDDKIKTGNDKIPSKRQYRKINNSCLKRVQRLVSGITIIVQGWRTYVRNEVMLSGLSLALLYMTVLGFDNITIGYAKMQCLSEFEVGLMMGGAGLLGTFGTFAYPAMRRCLGLPWTGMVALTLQSGALSMCVVSVWLPGSPFDLDKPESTGVVCEANFTTIINVTDLATFVTSTSSSTTELKMTSVAVLMAGIIGARFGLWIADLAITQMFMETVVESERGIVNGVQQSLNQFLDLVKFVLVIILPKTTQFGLLVILSYAFVFSGWILYLVFLIKVPKYLFSKANVLKV